MLWQVLRQTYTPQSTRGELIDNLAKHLAWTLERPVAEYPSDYHCIPPGIYEVRLYKSPRFGRIMPLLLTPNLAPNLRIEIHWGNYPQNFEGCIGVGETYGPDSIWQTREMFDELFPQIQYYVLNDRLDVEIVPGATPLHPDLSTQV